MDENQKLVEQEKAVKAIEKEIKDAKELEEEKQFFLDKVRTLWVKGVYKSTLGSWVVKLITALIVFFSVRASINFGLSETGSIINDFFAIPKISEIQSLILILLQIVLPIFWLFVPTFGTFLISIVLFASYATSSPLVILLAFLMLLMFQLEDRPVIALMIALPSLILINQTSFAIFVVALGAFVSTRKNNGTVKTIGFLYFALLELASGFFGNLEPVCPWQNVDETTVLSFLKNLFTSVGENQSTDTYLGTIMILLAIFFVVGLVFSKLLNLKYSRKNKLQIDILDAIIFASLFILLVLAFYAIDKYTAFTSFGYSYQSLLLQVVLAYVVTRVIADKSPNRGDTVMSESKKYIFISYAHSDIERVKPYLKILKKNGYEYWYDDSIETGTEWQGVIASNLANCTCFLAFISEKSIMSDYCLKEINYATSKNKPIAVIMLDDVMLPPVLEMHLASLQAVQRGKFDSDSDCMNKVLEMDQLNECKY